MQNIFDRKSAAQQMVVISEEALKADRGWETGIIFIGVRDWHREGGHTEAVCDNCKVVHLVLCNELGLRLSAGG